MNARIGCAGTEESVGAVLGTHRANVAGRQTMLAQLNPYTLTDRTPQTYDLQNYTYVVPTGNDGVQVSKSVVDYVLAPETMYRAGAHGGVQQDMWEIAGSAHRVLWSVECGYACPWPWPMATDVAPPKPRPNHTWRVELLTDKETGPKVMGAYQKRVAQILARVRPELEALALSADRT